MMLPICWPRAAMSLRWRLAVGGIEVTWHGRTIRTFMERMLHCCFNFISLIQMAVKKQLYLMNHGSQQREVSGMPKFITVRSLMQANKERDGGKLVTMIRPGVAYQQKITTNQTWSPRRMNR